MAEIKMSKRKAAKPQPPIITTKKMAEHFGVCHRTIFYWLSRRGMVTGRMPSGKRILTEPMINAWLLNYEQSRKSPEPMQKANAECDAQE